MFGITANYSPRAAATPGDTIAAHDADHPGGLTREHVVWAYRLLLDRDPENEDVIGPKLAGSRDTRELRHHLMTSAEFQEKNRDYAHTNDRTMVIKELDGPARAAVRRSVGPRHRSQHPSRALRSRTRSRSCGGMLKPGDTAIDVGAHIGFFTMQMAAAVGPAGTVYAFEPFDAERRSPRAIDRRKPVRRSRGLSRAPPSARAAGTATLTFPVETLNSGGAYLLRDGTAPLAGNLKTDVPVVALDDVATRAAGAVHQDGRRRRRAAGAARRAPSASGRPADDPLRAASDAARARVRA